MWRSKVTSPKITRITEKMQNHQKINLKVIVEAEGFEPQAKLVEVVDPTHGPAQRLDFDLAPVQVSSRKARRQRYVQMGR